MSKLAFTVLTIVVVAVIMGTSMISADAAGKPTKTISHNDFSFPGQAFCGTVATLDFTRTTELTVDGDGEQFKLKWIFDGELIKDGEVIGTYDAKNQRVGSFDSDGTFTGSINIHVKCLNGEKNENAHQGFTIDHNGKFHNHGPQ